MRTLMVNLYAGPGAGKSTVAAEIFAMLKKAGVDAELVQEYVKGWAWEERRPVTNDQFYFFGKQSRREYSLHGKVEVVATDSPLAICVYYAKVYGTENFAEVFCNMYKTYREESIENGVQYLDIFLERVGKYNPNGRFQTEDEVLQIDIDLETFLKDRLGIRNLIKIPADRTDLLFDIIQQIDLE